MLKLIKEDLTKNRRRHADVGRRHAGKVGVTPDETVLLSGADLAAERDPALARAITLLGGTMTAEQAGKFYRQ
jgi:hypothetical protein